MCFFTFSFVVHTAWSPTFVLLVTSHLFFFFCSTCRKCLPEEGGSRGREGHTTPIMNMPAHLSGLPGVRLTTSRPRRPQRPHSHTPPLPFWSQQTTSDNLHFYSSCSATTTALSPRTLTWHMHVGRRRRPSVVTSRCHMFNTVCAINVLYLFIYRPHAAQTALIASNCGSMLYNFFFVQVQVTHKFWFVESLFLAQTTNTHSHLRSDDVV